MFSSSLTAVVLLVRHWKNLDSYPNVDLQTLLQKHVVKKFSFHAFALVYTACLRKKLVSCPDNVLFCSGSVVLQWRRFFILGAKFGNEGNSLYIPHNLV